MMKGYLSKNQIDYVFYHFNFILELTDDIRNRIFFVIDKEKSVSEDKTGINIPLSSGNLITDQIRYISGIPVLFPMSEEDRFYRIEGKQVIFTHDLIKSAFYLLSGYQEYESKDVDEHGRFPYSSSIQKKLEITTKPIVNYYFEKLAEGIEQFCRLNNISFRRRKFFNSWGLMLTHDVDQLTTYHFFEWVYRLKILLGIVPSGWSFPQKARVFIRYLMYMLIPLSRKNLHWNFESLRRIEKRYGMDSVFYFLPKTRRDKHSFYRIDEPRVKRLVERLLQDGCEVGVHGTYESAGDGFVLSQLAQTMKESLNIRAFGIRQHFLKYDLPRTAWLQHNAGFKYDSTLGFAEHEGFRNSYCLPFKPYDFERDCMIDIWELPLIAMDATMFRYQNFSLQEARDALGRLLDEVERFHGLFTLLWHNGPIDDLRHKQTEYLYEAILWQLDQRQPQVITGSQMTEKMRSSTHIDGC